MVYSPGLENRYSSKNYRGFESLSLLLLVEEIFYFFCFARPGKLKSREWLGWGELAEPEKNDNFFELCYLVKFYMIYIIMIYEYI